MNYLDGIKAEKNEVSIDVADAEYIKMLEQRSFENERRDQHIFEGFTDNEIINYYIFHHRNIHKQDQSLSKNTQDTYLYILNQFQKLMHRILIKDNVLDPEETNIFTSISRRHILLYLELLSKLPSPKTGRPLATGSISTYGTVVKGFLKWLYKMDYLKNDKSVYFPSLEIPKKDIPDRDIYLDQIRRILTKLKQVNVYAYSIVLCLVTTGIRIAALCSIQMRDIKKRVIDGEEYFVIVVKEKGEKERHAVVHPQIFQDLLLPRIRRGESLDIGDQGQGYLFSNSNRRPFNPKKLSTSLSKWIEDAFKEENEKAVLEGRNSDVIPRVSPHVFRHGYAIYMMEIRHKTLSEIQTSLMHSTQATTARYVSNTLAEANDLGREIVPSDFLPHIGLSE